MSHSHNFLEEIAQENGLVGINPTTKLLMGIGSIILVLLSPGFLPPLVIAFILSMAIIFLARIDIGTYLRLLTIPLSFAVISVATIILITGGENPFWQLPLTSWLVLSITPESLQKGLLIFSRVFGGMIALFFISLTTPMTDLFGVAKKLKIPGELIDISMLMYKFIFIFIERTNEIHQAQVMRHGYHSLRESIESLGMLFGSLFITSWDYGDNFIRAMDARCYNGKIPKFGNETPIRIKSFSCVLITLAFFCIIIAILGDYPLIF